MSSNQLRTRVRSHALRCGLGVLLVGCATNPVTGRRELALISESQEISMGLEAAKQIDAVIQGAMAKDPAARFQTAQELAAAIHGIDLVGGTMPVSMALMHATDSMAPEAPSAWPIIDLVELIGMR